MTGRWTAETEELVALAMYLDEGPRAILTALADAGLLLPPGGETRQEWGVADVADRPDEVWPVESEDRARTRAARLNAVEAYPAARLYRRTITVHTGPWVVAVSET